MYIGRRAMDTGMVEILGGYTSMLVIGVGLASVAVHGHHHQRIETKFTIPKIFPDARWSPSFFAILGSWLAGGFERPETAPERHRQCVESSGPVPWGGNPTRRLLLCTMRDATVD